MDGLVGGRRLRARRPLAAARPHTQASGTSLKRQVPPRAERPDLTATSQPGSAPYFFLAIIGSSCGE